MQQQKRVLVPILAHALALCFCLGWFSQLAAQCQPRDFTPYEDAIIGIYLAYYGRPPDRGGLAYWSSRLEADDGSLESIIDAFGTSNEYNSRFGAMDDEQLISNLYFQMFGRDPEPGGLDFYIDKLQSGSSSLARICLDILYGAQRADAQVLENRARVARDFVTRLERHERDYSNAGLLLCHAQVDETQLDTICDAAEAVVTGGDPEEVTYRMEGLNLGIYVCPERDYRTGAILTQDPEVTPDMRMRAGQLDAMLRIAAPYTNWVRTFGCTNGLDFLARRAKEMGLRVALGAWIDKDPTTNQEEIDCALTAARQGYADMLIVGSEVLYRNDLPVEELLALIGQVKAQTDLPVPMPRCMGASSKTPR